MKYIYVAHHDDSPCEKKLINRYCASCKFAVDMQSMSLWPYCPKCVVPLEKKKCPTCNQVFEKPD